ncbi:hypothetical protein J6E39_03730 [bacterium]|nr:hypothetical protein [bacterium]
MRALLKLIFITALLLVPVQVFALELDMSVDDEIRKNYKPSELEVKQLPQLPNIDKTVVPQTSTKTSTQNSPAKNDTLPPKTGLTPIQSGGSHKVVKTQNAYVSNTGIDKSTAIKLKKGTKFKVKSLTNISDGTKIGARMSFKTQESVTQRYITIPAGSVLKGVIVDSHLPQKSGNGGLIVVKVDGIVYNGVQRSLNGKVTKANSKKIFFNNIKGKRKYMVNIPVYAKKGKPFYTKMMRTTSKLSQNPIGWILTPFTVVSGVVVYGATIVASPVSAAFSKGGRISVPAGAPFELKLVEDVYME